MLTGGPRVPNCGCGAQGSEGKGAGAWQEGACQAACPADSKTEDGQFASASALKHLHIAMRYKIDDVKV
jgi:hypothetical protein